MKEDKINGYQLSRIWFDWCFENPEKISPIHSALYFFCIEHCNRLGWKDKFGLPTTMAMEAIGIKSYNTYIKTFNDLIIFGFITLFEKSKNQYSANIIALSKYNKALDKALDKALIKHVTKQHESTGESISSIDKPLTINKEPLTTYSDYINIFNLVTGKTARGCKPSKTQFQARVKEGWKLEDFKKAIENACKDDYHISTGKKHLTLEFFTRSDKLDKFTQTIEIPVAKTPAQIGEDRMRAAAMQSGLYNQQS